MDVLRGFGASRAERPTVVTIGKFVIVHTGHAALLERVRDEAKRLDAAAAVVTFDRDPLETLRPEQAPCRLATVEQRLEQFEACGMDVVLLLEFTEDVAALEPEVFVQRTLVHTLRSRKAIVGEDFRFGHRRRGDIPLLQALGAEHGFEVEALRLRERDGAKISSTDVRRLVHDGRVDEAAALMGHPFRLAGRVVMGAQRGGALLGFPTVNLAVDARACLPAFGVYAGWWLWRATRFAGVINVGMTPTFKDVEAPKVEIHVLDFDTDVYGEQGEIEFTARLREERDFGDDLDALVRQIEADAQVARKALLG
jgi:riboflavin kinase/FMN adenylyltransferase